MVCPLKGAINGHLRCKVRSADQQGLQLEDEDEDQYVEVRTFQHPVGALVKNCNMLQNIVGPACIFLKQGFSQTLVCNTSVHAVFHHSFHPHQRHGRLTPLPSTHTSLTSPHPHHHHRWPGSGDQIPWQHTCSAGSMVEFHGKSLTDFVELFL